jgi:ATP-binding cassette, subfamily F, member 3
VGALRPLRISYFFVGVVRSRIASRSNSPTADKNRIFHDEIFCRFSTFVEILAHRSSLLYTPGVLTIHKLTKTLGGRTLLREAEMSINWGERVALVGPNGAGKSTLFRMILDEDSPDEGSIERDEYAITGYLPQEAGEPTDETILEIAMGITPEMIGLLRIIREGEKSGDLSSPEFGKAQDQFTALNGYQLEPKAKKILHGLGFKTDDFNKPAREYSGGWVMRAHLARLLVMEPDLLMLDEPTNHLDLLSLLWLQRYLLNYSGAILMISHDRDFMDTIIETVIEIDPDAAALISYTGNYSAFLAQRDARYEVQVQAYRNQNKEIEHVQEFIDRFRQVGSKAAQVQSRIKTLEKLVRIEKPRTPRKPFKFSFPQPPRSNQKVIELHKVCQAYGEKRIYKDLDLTIERNDRIVLVGPNGAGKSTLIKILAGQLEIDGGKREPGYATKIGYYSQHRAESLNEDNTVLEEVLAACTTLREEEARSILGSFLFRRTDVEKRCGILSGGEKSRLNLVKFLVDPPNLLLMDEPTTHLDILSIDSLVSALKNYQGTLVFISHDVHFIRTLAETTLHVNNGSVTRYTGGYDYFIEKSGLNDDRSAVTA